MKIQQQNGTISAYFTAGSDWEQVIYLFSDVHFDSIYCNRALYFAHLERAKQEHALILDGGDFFDAMQGRFDPRRSMDELRPEYRREDYYDFVINDAAEKLKPYAEQFFAFGTGNHEIAVRKNAGTDMTERLVALLRQNGSPVVRMGFKGWVRFMLMKNSGPPAGSLRLRFSHSGGGSNAPVTRGVIDTNREAVYLPDADIVWNGHNHQGWIIPIARERLSNKGMPYTDTVWFVRTPGYKADYLVDDLGYAAQKACGPTPLGCVRLVLYLLNKRPAVRAEVLLG